LTISPARENYTEAGGGKKEQTDTRREKKIKNLCQGGKEMGKRIFNCPDSFWKNKTEHEGLIKIRIENEKRRNNNPKKREKIKAHRCGEGGDIVWT